MKEGKKVSLVVVACSKDKVIPIAQGKTLANSSNLNVFWSYMRQAKPLSL